MRPPTDVALARAASPWSRAARMRRRVCGRPPIPPGPAHRAVRHRHARPAAVQRRSVVPGHHGDLRAAVRMGLPVADAEAHAADRGGAAGGDGRRPRVDDPAEARNPLHRRSGVQGEARASSSPRTTSTRTSAGSIRTGAAPASRSSPTSSSARGRSSKPPRRPASSTSTRRSRACARSTATRCRSGCSEPNYPNMRDMLELRRRRRARGRRGRRAATFARAPSAPVPSG